MTIVRGGAGIFFDRPQGNTVFDMGGNAPGVLSSQVQWGLLQNLTGGSSDPYPTLSLARPRTVSCLPRSTRGISACSTSSRAS